MRSINSFFEGLNSEDQFRNLAERKGYDVKSSDSKTDCVSHIDFILHKGGRTLTFDVKAPKRAYRHSKSQDLAIWIEFANVQGNEGWLYGEQEYIAFDFRDFFMIVKTSELRDYIHQLLATNKRKVTSPKYAENNFYSRKGRKDLLTKITPEKLFVLEHVKWYKH